MKNGIRQVAVLGAGVMGSALAAHMANAGLRTFLLDMAPRELDADDRKKGLTAASTAFRNKPARAGLDNALRARPAAFYMPEASKLITVGNFDDHLALLKDADWILEAVVEDLQVKKDLLGRVDKVRKPGAVISTNTSGLSIDRIGAALSAEAREHFLGTHFFNPPRYMKLVEIVPGSATGKEVVRQMAGFCEDRLGKGVVFARDVPNFIANRIGIHNVIYTIRTMLADGLTIEEVDAITGPPLGRPRSATFRTLDMVGLDTLKHVAANVYENVTDPQEKKDFLLPDFAERMVEAGLLGEKKGKGFYKKSDSPEGSQILTLEPRHLDYVPAQRPRLPALEALKQTADAGARIKALVSGNDRAGQFAWKVVKRLLLYSAARLPEIADDIVNVDRALKWGFNHELGPFETWDAIGLRESAARIEKEGERLPENVAGMLAADQDRFYRPSDGRVSYFDFPKAAYVDVPEKPQIILLPALKQRKKVIKSNAGASLIDIGDGVACLELHSPNDAIGADIVEMIDYGVDEVAANWEGMVIASQSVNFSVGANLMLVLMEAQNENWEELDFMVRQFQAAAMKIKFSEKPVVAAPYRMVLAGGCELCLASSCIRAHAETYMGLVEMGVGLLPAGGGTKEMLLRNIDPIPPMVPSAMMGSAHSDLAPFVARAFETIATAKVSTSAADAKKIGYLGPRDGVTLNQDHLIHDAKQTVLAMAREGFTPRRKRDDIRVSGRTGMAVLEAFVYNMKEGAYVTEHDARIARKIATCLTGGDLPLNTFVTEDYLLDLEREGFLSLCGEPKTQERIRAMLQTGRPLRN